MLFLAEIETGGMVSTSRVKSNGQCQQRKYKLKQKVKNENTSGLKLSQLAKKTSKVGFFSLGKIAIMQSLVKNDVKSPINNNVKQKIKASNIKMLKRTLNNRRNG